MGEPSRIGDLLVALPGMAERLAEARLLAAWGEIAGPAAARSRAEDVDDGLLRVAVDSSGWLHRLTLDEPALLARCRAAVPGVTLRGLRFRLAAPGAAPATPGSDATPPGARPAVRPASGPLEDHTNESIDTALDPVRAHPEIADALGRVLRASRVARGEGEIPR